MKYKELFSIRESLNEVDYIRGKAFAYAVFKNKEILDNEIKVLDAIKKQPHPDYMNFENERTLLCMQHSERDENNEILFNYLPDGNKSYKINDMDAFNQDYIKIAEKYEEVILDMETVKREYSEFLERDVDITFTKVNFKDLPDDINASFLDKIKFMIEN